MHTKIIYTALVGITLALVITQIKPESQVKPVTVTLKYPDPPKEYKPDVPYAKFINSLPTPSYPFPAKDLFQIKCLAVNLYHEARAEKTRAARIAPAFVVINRAKSVKFSNDYCKVIFEPWAFSWTMGPEDHFPRDTASFSESLKLSTTAFYGLEKSPVGLADHYYNAKLVSPAWGSRLVHVKNLGNHRYGVLK